MIHYAVAFALLLHVLFWGAGAALLAMPRPWRRLWPVLIVPLGFALQSAVVWAGAHAGLRGTNAYAVWAEVLPAALLGIAIRRHGMRATWNDLGRFGLVGATVGGVLALMVLPVAIASRGLTTISLGSCDAADYAAGARVLRVFARGDREGFLGLTEVVRIGSVDNFFDYWLRLNHFSPSALIAFNGSVLGCAPHELTTLFMAVLLAGTVPLVFWSARAIIGYNGGVSLIVGGLFGISPVMWYALAHVSPGQVLAAQGVVLLTWAGATLWRGRLAKGRVRKFFPVLAAGYWLILGGYNFFLLLCLVPAIAYAGGLAIWTRAWGRFARWLAWMLAPLLACAVVFNGRVTGLAERFALLQAHDFGWRIPALSAEGWLGMVQGPDLAAWDFLGARWILSAAVVGLIAWAFIREMPQRYRGAWTALAMILPVLAGYWFLQVRGARLGTNASYDAYKVFAVFYPLLLPAFCWWVTLRRSRKLHEWIFVVLVAGFVVGLNLVACGMFVWKMSRPPLIVDGELRQLRKIEAMADVKSVNLIFAESDMWSRLWANAFLLRKEQFFLTDTYEARWHTPLRGEWDLVGTIASANLFGDARRQVTPRFTLVDTRKPGWVRLQLGTGWHAEEFDSRGGERWQWTKADAKIEVEIPPNGSVPLMFTIDAWSPVDRVVSLRKEDGTVVDFGATVGAKRGKIVLAPIFLAPGKSTLQLISNPPPTLVPGDSRALGISVFHLEVMPSW